jgi:hypothetical protein
MVFRDPRLVVLIALGLLLTAGRGAAQVTTDRGAAVLIYPKIVADTSADTTLQLINLSDNRVNANCAYVDGVSGSWQTTSFTLSLESQRTVHWTATAGRTDDAFDVPAAPPAFRGELVCVQIDGTGAPFSGNELAGQATITKLASGDVSAYTAFGLHGSGLNDGDEFLCIGDATSDTCFLGVGEYDACPAEWILPLPAEGPSDAAISPGARVSTRVTVVPCSQNLRDGTPDSVDIDIIVFNELGERFTGTASVTCWADLALADIGGQLFDRAMLGTDFAEARLRPAEGSGGFLIVAETTHATGDAAVIAGSAAVTLHHLGAALESDVIVLPIMSPLP